MEKSFKISADYWNSLKPFEQDYINQRVHIDGIQDLKSKINLARKLYPDYIKIYGKGFIELPDGEIRLYSGNESKKFHKIVDGKIVFENLIKEFKNFENLLNEQHSM